MKSRILHLNENNTDIIMFSRYNNKASTNLETRKRMSRLLSQAIDKCLTKKQKICINEYYIHGKKQKEIATELGIDCSTVSRHICNAKKKLRDFVKVYENIITTNEED